MCERLPTLTRRCVYHAVSAFNGSYSAPSPGQKVALLGQITAFCAEMECTCSTPSSGSDLDPGRRLTQQSDLNGFVDGRVSVKDFCVLLEEALLRRSNGYPNVEALHDACFRFFTAATNSNGSVTNQTAALVERLSRVGLYRLWLVFNVLVGREDSVLMQKDNFRDVLKRFFEHSGLKWTNDPEELANKDCLTFSECLQVVKGQFERQDLRMPLTCEMIEDVYDEFVCGVQMKGYLFKRGHVSKNFQRRWFVLRRTELTYYKSKDTLLKKGQIFLGSETQVEDIPDTNKLTCAFELCCFMSGKPFLLVADTQKSKHQWMTTIKKVLVLTKLAELKGEKELYRQSLQHFYTLKYGSSSYSPCVADRELKIWDHYEGDVYLSDRNREDQQTPTIEEPSPATHSTGLLIDTFGMPIPEPPVVPIPEPSAVPIPVPPVVPIPEPSAVPIPVPPVVPILVPPGVPIPVPLTVPLLVPLAVPIQEPSVVPIQKPSAMPIPVPPGVPIQEPSAVPIPVPSVVPILEPSVVPIQEPSAVPIPEPSAVPILVPPDVPIPEPSAVPIPVPPAVPIPVPPAVPIPVPPTVLSNNESKLLQ